MAIRLLTILAGIFYGASPKQAGTSRPAPRRERGKAKGTRLNVEELDPRILPSADDVISGAIGLGAMSQTRTWTGEAINPATDVDIYGFSVAAGQRIAFDLDRPSGSLDSYFRLFNSSGTQLASNDDAAAPGEPFSYESYLEYTFSNAGTYYLGVSGYGNSGYNPVSGAGHTNGSTGAYTLILTPLSSGNADADDQIGEAISLGAMTQTRTRTGEAINPATDVDMFSFTVTAGQRVAIDLDRPAGSLDSYFRLFNGSGTQLASNDDGPTPGESSSYESYLEYTFSSAGTYYLGVSGYGNSGYNATTGAGDSNGSTGAYTLTVAPLSSGNADDNDQISEAISLGAMTQDRTWQSGTIDIPTDVDVFAFSVTAGHRVAFDLDRLASSGIDSYLRVFDGSGNQLAFNDDAAAPGESFSYESYVEYTFRTGGTYFVAVSGYGNSSYNPVTGVGDTNGSTGGYSLTLRPMVDIRALTPIADYTTPNMHVGNDYNTDWSNPQQDVGRVVVAPVSGRVVFFGQYGSGAGYGDLLVAIEVPVPMSTYRQREDGVSRPLTSGYVTVFLGHLTTRRYNTAGVLDSTAPQILLNVGDQVVAGQTHIGYVAPDGRRGAGTAPHVHVGALPYSENASGAAPFVTQSGTSTHYPGFWATNDMRPHLVDGQQSTYYNWVRSVMLAPPIDWDGWQRF